jgi:hypothetical protein
MARSTFAFPVLAVVTSVSAFMPRFLLHLLLLAGCLAAGREGHAQLASVDSGARAQVIASWDETTLQEWSRSNPWLRLRGHPIPTDQPAAIAREVSALRDLRARGFQPILFLRWVGNPWTSGVRPGSGHRLPLDLREMYRRGLDHGRIYGATGAAFEIENEPDIGFVQDNPETYMGFLKAAYLGLKAGSSVAQSAREDSALQAENSQTPRANFQTSPGALGASAFFKLGRPADRWLSAVIRPLASDLRSPTSGSSAPLVVMAPLALPPGPYFVQLVANGLFSYTDAFNYHYYGYAQDFTGVYRQFENAVADVGRDRRLVHRSLGEGGIPPVRKQAGYGNPALHKKSLPVLLTEYGYGSLPESDADTVEGRVRQWRWFKTVGEQILDLRIAGPMAFYLPPYLENKALEFGLTVVGRGLRTPPVGLNEAGSDLALGSPSSDLRPPAYALQFTAGSLTFTPADFGLKKPAPWMHRIGQKFGENEASPALAWLQETGRRKPYRPKHWTVHAPEPSPVVLDFIAGDGLVQLKRYGGYVAMNVGRGLRTPPSTTSELKAGFGDPALHPTKSGAGQVVLYNFSDVPVSGWLQVTQGRGLLADPAVLEREWTLEPMAREIVPVTLSVPADRFARHELALRFVHEGRRTEDGGQKSGLRSPTSDVRPLISLFSTFFYPQGSGMQERRLYDFHADVGRDRRIPPFSQPAGFGDPALQASGRWRVSDGVRVEETADGIWRFHVTAYPTERDQPATAELALPSDFVFPDGGMMLFSYRLAHPANTTAANSRSFEPHFRTANGNLYQVWPRQSAIGAWSGYTEVKENFTMAFYNRSNLPWRFRDNRPVALVFIFRPGRAGLPATYEVRDMRIVELVAGP